MGLTWLNDGFICKDLYAPFVLEKDNEYLQDLTERYELVLNQAEKAGADKKSLEIICKCKEKILKAVEAYYRADIAKSNKIIQKYIERISESPLAVNLLGKSYAFSRNGSGEIQFFRGRIGNLSDSYTIKDMLYLPEKLRAKSGNYRFSIPGNPSLYLANSSYGCWVETGFPAENVFNISPIVLDGKQKIFNLAVSIRDYRFLEDFDEKRVHCWLKLYMLTIATSYRILESERTFRSEYIISQAVMMACKRLGFDGVAYYSKRVYDEIFAFCAINLALFVNYAGEYSDLINHMKMDDPFNYGLFKQLCASNKYSVYDLGILHSGIITNIGNYGRQYAYKETEFYSFDNFLFASWRDKPNGKGKDTIPWGLQIN